MSDNKKTDDEGAEESPVLVLFKKDAHEAMLNRINMSSAFKLSPEELLAEIENFIFEFARERRAQVTKREQKIIASELVDDMIGLGPLETLLADETISDIVVNGPNQIYVERGGIMRLTSSKFRNDQHVLQIAQRIAHRI